MAPHRKYNPLWVRVVGLGHWGSDVVGHMMPIETEHLDCIAVGEPQQNIDPLRADRLVLLHPHGFGAPAPRTAATRADKVSLLGLLEPVEWVWIVADPHEPRWNRVAVWLAQQARIRGALSVLVFEDGPLGPAAQPHAFDGTTLLVPVAQSSARRCAKAVWSVVSTLLYQGYIGIDFEMVRDVLQPRGTARVGVGVGTGPRRCSTAFESALAEIRNQGGHTSAVGGFLILIVGGSDLSLQEVNEGLMLLHAEAHFDSEIAFQSLIDDAVSGEVIVTVILRNGASPRGHFFGATSLTRHTSAMGLCLSSQYLVELEEFGSEGAVWFRKALKELNHVLKDNGLAAHREPVKAGRTKPRPHVRGFPYSYLHHLRRVHARLRSGLPVTPLEGDEDPTSEPAIKDVASLLNSHLVCHGDAQGYYVPQDFEEVIVDDRVAGGILGSTNRLMAELVEIAPAIGIKLARGGQLPDATAKALAEEEADDSPYWCERMVWLALFEHARCSIANGTLLVFS